MVYGHLLCVFQHLSRGCLRINMAFTYWQALVTPPSLSLLSFFVWLMEAKPEFYRETSDEQILMLAKMVNIFFFELYTVSPKASQAQGTNLCRCGPNVKFRSGRESNPGGGTHSCEPFTTRARCPG